MAYHYCVLFLSHVLVLWKPGGFPGGNPLAEEQGLKSPGYFLPSCGSAHLKACSSSFREGAEGKQDLLSAFCCCSVTQLCLTLCDPMDCSMPRFTTSGGLLKLMSITLTITQSPSPTQFYHDGGRKCSVFSCVCHIQLPHNLTHNLKCELYTALLHSIGQSHCHHLQGYHSVWWICTDTKKGAMRIFRQGIFHIFKYIHTPKTKLMNQASNGFLR